MRVKGLVQGVSMVTVMNCGLQEADIVGRDGQIYRGRFSVHQLKNPETKLPTIGSRDGGSVWIGSEP